MSDPTSAYVAQWDTLDTTSTVATKFNTCWSRWPNPWDATRDNHVYIMGWNKSPGGGPENVNDDAFGLHFEQYWLNKPGHGLMEFHLDWWQARTRTSLRPFTMALDRADGTVEAGWNVHKMSFYVMDGTGAQWMILAPGSISLLRSSVLRHGTNNTPFLAQLNAAKDAYVSMVYLDDQDRVVIGPSGKAQLKVGQGKADLSGVYAVNGKQVVGPQQPAIPNPVTLDDVIANQTAILNALRAHGLIAS